MTQGQPEEYSEENVNELVGGIKNALDKGEELNKVKQSFFNAGYNKREIDEATAVLGLSEQPLPVTAPEQSAVKPLSVQPLPVTAPEQSAVNSIPVIQKTIEPILPQKTISPVILPQSNIVFASKKETQRLPVARFEEPQPLNKALVVVLILLGILFVVIAGFLGVFWDQLFGPF